MLERLRAMLVKEFIQVFRDPRMRIVLFVLPVLQTIIFGYAVNTDIREVATAVQDSDETPASREVVQAFAGSGYFRIVEDTADESRLARMIDGGEVKAVLRIDKGFGEKRGRGENAPLQLILDGTDSNTAGIVASYASRIVAGLGGGRRQAVLMETRAWFNPNLESRNFYIPAVIANIVFVITMLLSSMAVVREKEIGTIEQVIVTPIRKSEFILGKTIPFVLIGFIDVAAVSIAGTLWFDVPIRGSIPLLFLATALFLMSSLGFGLLISTISRTQQQAMMAAFFFVFPAMLLSGFAFPIDNMPPPVQWITLLNPVRHYLVIIRGIFLKGVGMRILFPEMAGLLLLGIAILTLAVLRFRKTAL
jgi:ABC-2 type transport system permease protein